MNVFKKFPTLALVKSTYGLATRESNHRLDTGILEISENKVNYCRNEDDAVIVQVGWVVNDGFEIDTGLIENIKDIHSKLVRFFEGGCHDGISMLVMFLDSNDRGYSIYGDDADDCETVHAEAKTFDELLDKIENPKKPETSKPVFELKQSTVARDPSKNTDKRSNDELTYALAEIEGVKAVHRDPDLPVFIQETEFLTGKTYDGYTNLFKDMGKKMCFDLQIKYKVQIEDRDTHFVGCINDPEMPLLLTSADADPQRVIVTTILEYVSRKIKWLEKQAQS